jgi:hypothetical protein
LRLSLDERESISRGVARKMTLTAIAAELGRSVSDDLAGGAPYQRAERLPGGSGGSAGDRLQRPAAAGQAGRAASVARLRRGQAERLLGTDADQPPATRRSP